MQGLGCWVRRRRRFTVDGCDNNCAGRPALTYRPVAFCNDLRVLPAHNRSVAISSLER